MAVRQLKSINYRTQTVRKGIVSHKLSGIKSGDRTRLNKVNLSLIHDLSGPLTSASIHLEQLETSQTDTDLINLKNDINILIEYVKQAKDEMVNQQTNAWFSLLATINQANQLVANYASRSGVSIYSFSDEELLIYGNQLKLIRGLVNILNNSVEALMDLDQQNKAIKISYRRIATGLAEITIEDNGCGIKHEDINKVFKPHYSTKNHTNHHLGIGLSMLKEYIEEDVHGKINLTSQYGIGTIIKIILPIKVSDK